MKLKIAHIFAFAGLLFLLTSCDGCNNNGPGCNPVWAVEYINPGLIAEVDSVNHTLSLQVSGMASGVGIQGEAYQEYFVGDFNVVAPFSNFVGTSGPGRPYAELIMYNSDVPDTIIDTTFVRAGISSTHIYTYCGLQKQEKVRLPTTTSGTFRIQKIGGAMLGQVIAGGDTVMLNILMPFNPVRFAVRLGSFGDSAVTGPVAIKINAFPVSGTTGCTLQSDEFKCNSIYIP